MVTSKVDKLAADYEHLPICANAKIWNLARELEKQNAQMLEALEACAAYWHCKRSPGIPEHSELVSLNAEQAQRLIKAAIAAAKWEV